MRALSFLHFSDSDGGGGAAKSAYRLHCALRKAGATSLMRVRIKRTDDGDVIQVRSLPRPWRSRLARLRGRLNLDRSPPSTRYTFSFDEPQAFVRADLHLPPDELDVVYLHHLRMFLTVRDVASLHRHYRRPFVQYLLDQAAVTGGCHYALDCDGFTRSCGACPQLGSSDERDLTRRLWLRKRELLAGLPLSFVAPSTQAASWVERSSLFAGRRVAVIPHAIDATVFRPGDRRFARALLGVPAEAKVVAFGALGLDNPYKEIGLAVESLWRLAAACDERARRSLFCLVVGEGGRERLAELPVPARALGRLTDDVAMALAYQAADVFLSSSRADAGPQTVAESLLCGTPVVSFPVGRAADLIRRPETGFLAPEGDAEALAHGLRTVLERGSSPAVQAACREAAAEHSYERVARAHLDLVESLRSPEREAVGSVL